MVYDPSINYDELMHYGVAGMKWGVHRAVAKRGANLKLTKKALDNDKKSAKLTRKSEKFHALYDLESSNGKAIKAARYDARAAAVAKKVLKSDNDIKQLALTRKSENLKYKAAKARIQANSISKTESYGYKAMKYSIKSDQAALRAARARKKIANNNHYIATMKRKVSSLSEEEINGGYSFVNELLAG